MYVCVVEKERIQGGGRAIGSTKFRPVHLSKSNENSAMDTQIHNRAHGIHRAPEYLWNHAEDEWEITRGSFVILCAPVLCAPAVHRKHVKRFSRDAVSSPFLSNDAASLQRCHRWHLTSPLSVRHSGPSDSRGQEKFLVTFDDVSQHLFGWLFFWLEIYGNLFAKRSR